MYTCRKIELDLQDAKEGLPGKKEKKQEEAAAGSFPDVQCGIARTEVAHSRKWVKLKRRMVHEC
jgi:hypothetical protein